MIKYWVLSHHHHHSSFVLSMGRRLQLTQPLLVRTTICCFNDLSKTQSRYFSSVGSHAIYDLPRCRLPSTIPSSTNLTILSLFTQHKWPSYVYCIVTAWSNHFNQWRTTYTPLLHCQSKRLFVVHSIINDKRSRQDLHTLSNRFPICDQSGAYPWAARGDAATPLYRVISFMF